MCGYISSSRKKRAHAFFFEFLLFLFGGVVSAKSAAPAVNPGDDQYVLGPDSLPQLNVPQGKIFRFTFTQSKVFPGTSRTITVYTPAQYNADKPACVYIGLDGIIVHDPAGSFEVPVVFDNLITKHEMPVTIAIGVSPGMVDSASPPDNPRFNRSFEFDGLNGNLARLLIEEVLPEVQRHKTSDGLPIRLSRDANDRAVGGFSTGAIGAFTLAWERPDEFRRVFSAIGTFVGMRGGDRYAVLVRKTEPKPIRIFMQDGSNDELTGSLGEVGDWWMSNQTLERALKFAGYQIEHVWGEGSHNLKHQSAIFPDAMRWLWRGWPQPIESGDSQNTFLNDILGSGGGWESISGTYQSAGVLAANGGGEVVLWDTRGGKAWKIGDDGNLREYLDIGGPYAGLAFGADGRGYITDTENARIVVYSTDGNSRTIAKGVRALNLVVTNNGTLYATEAGIGDSKSGKVYVIKSNGEKSVLDTGLNEPSGIALSPDNLWLAVTERKSHWGYSYRVEPDHTVRNKQQFYWFHVPDEADDSGAVAWVPDRDGRLYAATRMGVQIFDRNGRVRAIVPVPGGEVSGITFGGSDFGTLYVSCADHKVYRRKVKVRGMSPSAPPARLASWSPG